LALLTPSGPSPGANGNRPAEAVDLQRTAALVARWGSRPSFPESVTFAYYHLYVSGALDQDVSAGIRDKISDYIVACQQPDGGFTPKPEHTKTSSVIYTYYALEALQLLGNTKQIDTQAALDFLHARMQDTGGIAATAREGEQANLATTYYGIEALRLLKAMDSLSKRQRDRLTAFIHRYREPARGFTRVEGAVSIPQSTFMGVRALQHLGALTDTIRSEVIAYLKDTRYSGLVKDKKYRMQPNIEAMAATLQALATLSATAELNTANVLRFIRSLYVPVNGGFGPRPGLGTTPPSTYHAIVSLVQLQELPDPVTRPRPAGTAAKR
jgi:prenyltransferase beta subunit